VVKRAPVTTDDLPELRATADELARKAGLDDDRAAGFATAVSEVATNSITHAGGTGEITMVEEDETALYAEVTDHGPGMPTEPPELPPADATSGRGLWLSRELADSLHIDSGPDGSTVYVDMTVEPPADQD